uniref:PDZ domain-containing protein n=1 Tax=Fibrocapsa japonica TaxID=94617 RepID=A0A7S2V143_9STRA
MKNIEDTVLQLHAESAKSKAPPAPAPPAPKQATPPEPPMACQENIPVEGTQLPPSNQSSIPEATQSPANILSNPPEAVQLLAAPNQTNSPDPAGNDASQTQTCAVPSTSNILGPMAFAEVREVSEGSPAASAGLQAGDRVVKFGSVNAGNHRDLAAVADVARNNIGQSIQVAIEREGSAMMTLDLVPQRWSGSGVLGCHICLM